jgi:hypothetical protein
MAAKGETGSGEEGAEGDNFGTEVGMSNINGAGAASAVTFDDDKSELISDTPSMDNDKVDMGADDVEAYADKVDAEAELEKPETGTEGTEGGEGASTGTGENTDVTGENTDLGDAGDTGSTELDLGDTNNKPEGEDKTEEKPEEKKPEKEEEAAGAPNKNLERTNFNKDKNPNDISDAKPAKKVYLKRPKQTK